MRYPKLRPYSREPGTYALIPRTSYYAQVFPALFVLYDFEEKEHLRIAFEGTFDDFILFQDLEKGCLEVYLKERGESKSYRILVEKELEILILKGPLSFEIGSLKKALLTKEKASLFSLKSYLPRTGKLYLGTDKKLCLNSLHEREDLRGSSSLVPSG